MGIPAAGFGQLIPFKRVAFCLVLFTLYPMKNLKQTARSLSLLSCVLFLLITLAACGSGETGSQQQQSTQHGADARIATHSKGNSPTLPGSVTVAGISFTPPSHWKNLEASGMRQAQFRLPPVGSDTAEGEVNVYYFGPQSGGGVEANLQRWIGQMVLPEGADPATAITKGTFTADGMAGHLVALNGGYKSGGGRPMGGEKVLLPGYRLVGVVLEGPEGSLFFKLTGPRKTAEIMETELMKMVRSATQ